MPLTNLILNSMMKTIQCIDDDLPIGDSTILAYNYIKWKLAKSEIMWEEWQQLPGGGVAETALTALCELFDDHCDEKLNDLFQEICENHDFNRYMGLCEYLFDAGIITWGRIVALFSYSGLLAVYCFNNGEPALVASVTDWLTVYCDGKLSSWIQNHNSWVLSIISVCVCAHIDIFILGRIDRILESSSKTNGAM